MGIAPNKCPLSGRFRPLMSVVVVTLLAHCRYGAILGWIAALRPHFGHQIASRMAPKPDIPAARRSRQQVKLTMKKVSMTLTGAIECENPESKIYNSKSKSTQMNDNTKFFQYT